MQAPESVNTPARVCLVSVPDKKVLRQKNLYSVIDCKLHWHPDGHFLCVQVTRHSKSKKTLFTNMEMFRMMDIDFPVEMFEVRADGVGSAPSCSKRPAALGSRDSMPSFGCV